VYLGTFQRFTMEGTLCGTLVTYRRIWDMSTSSVDTKTVKRRQVMRTVLTCIDSKPFLENPQQVE